MKNLSISCVCLSLVVCQASALAAPGPQPRVTHNQVFSKLLCQRLEQGERFDTAMLRVMADLADQDESFAVMLISDNPGFEKLGEVVVKVCPGAVGAGFDRMPSKVRSLYFK